MTKLPIDSTKEVMLESLSEKAIWQAPKLEKLVLDDIAGGSVFVSENAGGVMSGS